MGVGSPIKRYVKSVIDPDIRRMQLLGSSMLAQTFSPDFINTATNPVPARIHIGPIFIAQPMIATGLALFFSGTGNYTASDNNKVAIYRYSAGSYLRVAQSANTPTLFSTGATVHGADFTAQVPLTPDNLYFAAFLYNRSAEVTPATLGARAVGIGVTMATMDFPSALRGKAWATLAAQTDMPSVLLNNGTGGALQATSSMPWMAVY